MKIFLYTLIIVQCLNITYSYAQVSGTIENSLSELKKAIFPYNSLENEKDTILSIPYGDKMHHVIGRKNQPDFLKAENLLFTLRKASSDSVYKELLLLAKLYETKYMEEWGVDYYNIRVPFDLVFPTKPQKAFSLIEEFEKTLFALEMDNIESDKERYFLALERFWNTKNNDNKYKKLETSQKHGHVTGAVELQYIYDNRNQFCSFLKQTLVRFSETKATENELAGMYSILDIIGETRGDFFNALLVNKLKITKNRNLKFVLMMTLAKRSSLDYLIKLLQEHNTTQTGYIVSYIYQYSDKSIIRGNEALASALLQKDISNIKGNIDKEEVLVLLSLTETSASIDRLIEFSKDKAVGNYSRFLLKEIIKRNPEFPSRNRIELVLDKNQSY